MRLRIALAAAALAVPAGACLRPPADDLPGPQVAASFLSLPQDQVERAVAALEGAGLWRVAPVQPAAVPMTSQTYRELERTVAPGVVHVYTGLTMIGRFYQDPLGMMPFRIWFPVPHRGTSLGSGFHLGRGYVVTTRSVVGTAKDVTVLYRDGTSHQARVVGDIPASDVVLLRYATEPGQQPDLALGSALSVATGDRIAVVGNPWGAGHSVRDGIVGFRGTQLRLDDEQTGAGGVELLQTTAQVERHEAGAPIVDLHGAVIGMVVWPDAKVVSGPAYGVPVEVIEQSIAYLLMQLPMELPLPVELPALPSLPLPGS